MSDFWETLAQGHTNLSVPNAVDTYLSGRALGASFESMRDLTEQGRAAAALDLPVKAGTRVAFAGTLGAFLSMQNPPNKGAEGTVVTVRSAQGDVTAHDGKVFVKWADGEFRPVHAEFLRLAADQPQGKRARTATKDPTDVLGRIPASQTRIRVASLGDLTSFLKLADNTLVHKSTMDLWSFNKDADGGLVVERLFDGNGSPLKA